MDFFQVEFNCQLSIGGVSCSTPGACQSLSIKVQNVNDNPPEYNRTGFQYNINLQENLTNPQVLKLTANDLDDLGSLSFKIEGNHEPFALTEIGHDPKSAWLSVDGGLLDYEKQQFWSLTMSVHDQIDDFGNQYKDEIQLFITVEDIGDNPPRWQKYPSVYEFNEGIALVRVEEFLSILTKISFKDTPLFEISAFDQDRGVQNRISYEIEKIIYEGEPLPQDFMFLKVDQSSGVVSVIMDVDREKFNESNYFEVSITLRMPSFENIYVLLKGFILCQ